MAGFRTRRQIVSASGSKIADAKAVSFELESTDGEKFITATTTDGSESITLGQATKITGPTGTTGMAIPATNTALLVENTGSGSGSKCYIDINADGTGGSGVRFFQADAEKASIAGYQDQLLLKTEDESIPIILTCGGTEAMRLVRDSSSDKIMVGINGAPDDQNNPVLQLTGDGSESELIIRRAASGQSNDEVAYLGYRAQGVFSIDAEGGIQFRNQGGSKRAEFDSSGNFTAYHLATINSASPTLILDNSESEDSDGGRESTIRFSGKQSGDEAHYLAEIVGSHRGSDDNQNGQIIFKLNGGSSGTSLSSYHHFDGASANVGFNGLWQSGYRLTLNANDSNPGMAIKNGNSSDADLSGKTRIDFQRRQGGNEYSEAARIETRHDGALDDTKGEFAISTNTGSGLQEQLVINSSGDVGGRRFAGIPGVSSDVHLSGAGSGGDVKINNGGGRDVIVYNGSSAVIVKVDASESSMTVGADAVPVHTLHVQDGDLGVVTNSADDAAKKLVFTKSRNATDGSHTIIQDDDSLGIIDFYGSDGNSFALGARIMAKVNGTPGDGDMPTELVFQTTPDGSETPSTRLSLSNNGISAFTTDTASCLTLGRTSSGDKLEIRSSAGTELNVHGTQSLRVTQSYKEIADFNGETLVLENESYGYSGSAGGLWVDLSNTCTSSGTGNKTIASTAHGLKVADAVALPSGNSNVYEVFKVAAVGSANEFTVDTNLTNSISSAVGNTDGTKLAIKTGHGDARFTVAGSGKTVIQSGHPMLELQNEDALLRHKWEDYWYVQNAGSGSDRTKITGSTVGSYMRYSTLNLGDVLETNEAQLHVLVGADTSDRPAIKISQTDTTNNPYGLEINNTGSGDSIRDDSGAKLTAAGVWTDASDVLHKEDIVDIPYGLAEVLQMQPRKYKLRKTGEEDIGFISQEMEAIIPEVVFGDDAVIRDKVIDVTARPAKLTEDGEEIDPAREEKARFNVPTAGKSLSYSHLTAVLVRAVQELELKIKALEEAQGN